MTLRKLQIRHCARRFFADESAATAVEYAVICACIFLTIVSAVVAFGSAATNMFNNLASAVNAS